ncbi:MAG: hypothetical protein R3C28_09340 [Pirellulaceae bacterium]
MTHNRIRSYVSTIWLATHLITTALAAEPPIQCVTFSPDGQSVVAAQQGVIRIYDWPSLQPNRLADNLDWSHLYRLRFVSNDQMLAAGGRPGEYGEWALFTWPELTILRQHVVHDDVIHDAILCQTNVSAAVVSAEGDQLRLWNLTDQPSKPIATLTGHSRRILSLHPIDQHLFVSSSADHTLRLWDANSATLVRSLENHTDSVLQVEVRPAERPLPQIASCGADRTIRFWQPTIGRMMRFVRLDVTPVTIAWTPEGKHLATVDQRGTVYWIDPETASIVQQSQAESTAWPFSLAVHPDDHRVILGGENGMLRIVQPPTE